MQPNRAIFLDFDGVLHDPDAGAALATVRPILAIREKAPRIFAHASLLAQVLADAPDVKIVVTSPWRLMLSDLELRQLLPELARRLAGTTARGPRAAMIRAFVEQQSLRSFLVLDGEPQAFEPPWPEVVACNPVLGLAEPQALEAVMRWLRTSS